MCKPVDWIKAGKRDMKTCGLLYDTFYCEGSRIGQSAGHNIDIMFFPLERVWEFSYFKGNFYAASKTKTWAHALRSHIQHFMEYSPFKERNHYSLSFLSLLRYLPATTSLELVQTCAKSVSILHL